MKYLLITTAAILALSPLSAIAQTAEEGHVAIATQEWRTLIGHSRGGSEAKAKEACYSLSSHLGYTSYWLGFKPSWLGRVWLCYGEINTTLS